MWASLVVLACFASAAAAGTRQLPFQSLRPDIMRAFIKKSGPSVPKGILAITLRDKCDECEAQAYNLHLLFSSFEDEPDVLSMGTVNVETQVEFAKVIGVTTDHPVPSLYLARPGEAPQRYTGSWDQLAVVKWVDTQLSTNVTATHVVPLSLATFNQRVSLPRQHSVIEFYAPWCGVCKTLTPPFEKAARALRYEKSVLFGKVNAAQVPLCVSPLPH